MRLILLGTLLFFSSISLAAQWDIIITLHDECVISKYYTHTLNELHSEFSSEDYNWTGIFSFANATEEKMNRFEEKYALDLPLVLDIDQKICSRYDMKITPEVVIIEQETGDVLYKGRIDNAYARVGKRRPEPTIHNLQQALSALEKGELPIKKETEAIGCYITPL